jgi:uncharacterized protein (TIGR02246 family)
VNADIAERDRAALSEIIRSMETAWNAGDADGFASPFGQDGDQVNIFGTHLRNRDEIRIRHAQIFQTVFLSSINSLTLQDARYVTADVILGHVRSAVTVPQGPLQGELCTLASLVFRKTAGRWEVVTFHNTRIAEGSQ